MRIKSLLLLMVLTLAAPLSATAGADTWIKQTVHGMDCAPCAYAVERSLGRLPGVNAVDVSLNRGSVEMNLTPEAELDMAEVRRIIERNGFTPRDAELRLHGELSEENGAYVFRVGESRFEIEPTDAVPAEGLERWSGQWVTVRGLVPESVSDRIQVLDIGQAD